MTKFGSTHIVMATLVLVPVVVQFIRKMRLAKENKTKSNLKKIEKVPPPTMREYFLRLPGYTVAAVIGRRGSMLRTIMQETQTECVVKSYTREELEKSEVLRIDRFPGWKDDNKTPDDDWFEDDKKENIEKISYLIVKTDNPRKFELVRMKIVEIATLLQKNWKTTEILIDSEHIGFIVGRQGKNVRNICANYNVKINVSSPLKNDPSKAIVTIHGRDTISMKRAEVVIRETGVPKKLERVPKYDMEPLGNGLHSDITEELEEIRKIGEQLSEEAF